jgi:3-phosphoshikimate 1-carboxyvinyltransferase
MSDRFVSGGGHLMGDVDVPGDKSVSHRALIFGALADGITSVQGLALGADVRSTRGVLEALGVEMEGAGLSVRVTGRGVGGLLAPKKDLDAGNSGTTMRLMAGVLAGHPFSSRLFGDESLSRRPMERVAAPLRELGAQIQLQAGGVAPMSLTGGALTGKLIRLSVASAQVKSAVLLAGLHASGRTTVIEPAATRDHTEKMLALFGVNVVREGLSTSIDAGARLRATAIDVPGDPSSAAFWAVAASLAPQSLIRIRSIISSPTRTGFLNVLKRMGADILRDKIGMRAGEDCEDVIVRSSRLQATTIEADEVPGLVDEVPILALAAAMADGVSRFCGLDELRHKESDRLAGIAKLLSDFGANARVSGDDLIIKGPTLSLRGTTVDSLHDHRLAMTGFVAGFLATGRTTILHADCAEISYPSFYEDFKVRIKS